MKDYEKQFEGRDVEVKSCRRFGEAIRHENAPVDYESSLDEVWRCAVRDLGPPGLRIGAPGSSMKLFPTQYGVRPAAQDAHQAGVVTGKRKRSTSVRYQMWT